MKKILESITTLGWQGRMVSVEHLAELQDSIESRYSGGLIDKKLYREQLGFLSFDLPSDLPAARSIIIAAVPTPQMRITMNWHGKSILVIIPPTYVSYTPRTINTREIIAEFIREAGYHVAATRLPLKTLAVRSGLADYGRNNICYVKGMGSFLQLVGAFTDLPCEKDSWRESEMMERCKTCTACLRKCPSRAITKERFLIHAEACLTYHNESADDFPDWINPSWHQCLFGCMKCQTVCPENKTKLDWFEDRAEFTEKETSLLISRQPFDSIPEQTASKIRSLQINEKFELLCRNLSMIIRAS